MLSKGIIYIYNSPHWISIGLRKFHCSLFDLFGKELTSLLGCSVLSGGIFMCLT